MDPKLLIFLVISCLPIPGRPSAIPRSISTDGRDVMSGENYDYEQALNLSLLFYEAQRSGRLPKDNRIPWRGDSALGDVGLDGEDLTGGYYDAADYVKFVWTQAAASTLIAWGLTTSSAGYEKAGLLQRGLECLRWGTDFLIKCHVKPNELYGQIGDFGIDQKFWGRPEDMNMTRPAFKINTERPGSDLAGETAAALAATSLVFSKHGDKKYAELCLRHAKELYIFARDYRGLHHLSMRAGVAYYESNSYGDELAWAAVWLYKATQDEQYLQESELHYNTFRLKERPNEFSLGHRVAGIQILLAEITRQEEYKTAASEFCDHQVSGQKRSSGGLLYVERTGALSHAANIAFICLQASIFGKNQLAYKKLAQQQIDYILGSSGRSFVVGFGKDSPKQPHHASSSCPDRPASCGWDQYYSKESNPQILYGALVSGPDENDYFIDSREEYIYTEVTIEYNAGFQSSLAMLIYERYRPGYPDNRSSDSNEITYDRKKNLGDVKIFNQTNHFNQISILNL